MVILPCTHRVSTLDPNVREFQSRMRSGRLNLELLLQFYMGIPHNSNVREVAAIPGTIPSPDSPWTPFNDLVCFCSFYDYLYHADYVCFLSFITITKNFRDCYNILLSNG
jgi:hypothetical protein